MTINNLNSSTFAFDGGGALAFERSAMLAGQPARVIKFGPLGQRYGGLLPSDLDGSTLPPAGSPNFFAAVDTTPTNGVGSTFELWKFHVDWSNTANSTFGISNAPNFNLTTDAYNFNLCGGSRDCIPQPNLVGVDALADRLMYRLQYRSFPDGHESLVANHTVNVSTTGGNQAGVRWYEVRGLSGTPTIFQQGTYAPDSTNRWMGSIAMDQAGNVALGYSVSSGSVFPSVRYTGRIASDALGTLPQGEATIIAGAGSQTSSTHRWGDYSAMAVDPVDDCTFWYTQEYYVSTTVAGWHTHIGSFKFPGCPPATIPPPAPTGLTATPVSPTQINLSWTGSVGATSYKLERSLDGTTFAQIATPAGPSYSDTGLSPATTYYYRVRASNTFGDSPYSNVASATTYLGYTQAPQGNWVGTYGANGYALLGWNGGGGDLTSLPLATLTLDQGGRYQWTTSTTDVRALQSPDATSRRATTVYDGAQVKLHLTFANAYSGNLHLYALDWDSTSRRETITITDANGSRTAILNASFDQGAWINLPINVATGGSVPITVTDNGGPHGVLPGLLLG